MTFCFSLRFLQIFKNFANFSAFQVIFWHIFGFFGEKVDPTETRAAFLGSQVGVPAVRAVRTRAQQRIKSSKLAAFMVSI